MSKVCKLRHSFMEVCQNMVCQGDTHCRRPVYLGIFPAPTVSQQIPLGQGPQNISLSSYSLLLYHNTPHSTWCTLTLPSCTASTSLTRSIGLWPHQGNNRGLSLLWKVQAVPTLWGHLIIIIRIIYRLLWCFLDLVYWVFFLEGLCLLHWQISQWGKGGMASNP